MNNWQIKLLYDGLCPICSRKIRFMRRMDRRHRLAFQDITDPGFDASHYGITLQETVSAMHGILPDGSIARGMAAFRIAYKAIGLGWLVAPTGWPVLRPIFDWLYRLFARHRPRFSKFAGERCESGACQAKDFRKNRTSENKT